MEKIDITPKLYSRGKAIKVAKLMNKIDDAWDYRAIHDPKGTGYSFIAIYDEDDFFIGKLCI